MKILLVEYRDITHPEAGGAEVILLEVFKRIAAAGHQVDYLCNRHGNAAAEETRDGIRYIRRGQQPYFNYLVPFVYRSELRRNGYDLIIEGIDKIPFYLPLFERKVPVLGIIPHLFGTTVFREASWPVAAYVYLFERLIPSVYRKCRFSVLSQSTRDDLIARGLPAEQVHLIYSGLTQSAYQAPAQKPARVRPTLIYLGRIKKYKGIELGIHAVKKLSEKYPDIDYQVVCVGDFLDSLRQLARDLGVERNVSFLGLKRGQEKTELLQRADVLIYTSPKEGWGLSVIEANACGTLVVASDAPGLRESVLNEKTGFLIPHGDVAALAQRIDQLLSDSQLYGQMRARAIEWAQTFTWERATQETLDLMQRCVAEKRASKQ
jgi:glycosyltransferase involved in cell wall biosynthesis